MTTLPNTGMTLPLRGSSGSGKWGDTLDDNLRIIDEMDHTPGKGARIPTAGIVINADLPFSSLYAPTQLHRAQFSAIAGAALTGAQNLSLFVSDGTGGLAANELYFRTSAGNAIRFTSGSSLNVGAFVGGIGGDYASVGAQLNYDDAGKRYTFKEGTGDSSGWARLAAGGLRLIEFNTSEAVYVEQLAPSALASSYSMTWPTALPGSAQIVQIDSTGQLIFSNALAANQSVTVSGTGELKHGNATLVLPACIGLTSSGTFTFNTDGSVASASSGFWVIPVPLTTGDRVQAVTFAGFGDGAVDVTVNVNYIAKTSASSTKATITITNSPAGFNDSTATVGAPVALAAGEVCVIAVNPNATGFVFNNFRVVYDRP
jgi:hypothetical protein